MLKENIVVLYANPYSMVDEDTKQRNDGVSVNYLYGTSLAASMAADGSQGQRPARGSLKPDLWGKIVCAPALYEGSFEMAIGSNGKPTLRLVDVDYLSHVDLDIVDIEKAAQKGGNK